MNMWEILITGIVLIHLILILFAKKKQLKIRLALVLIGDGLFIFYALLEGVRWQMVPLLVLLVGFSIMDLLLLVQKSKDVPEKQPKKWLRVLGGVLLGLITLVAVIFPMLLPVVDLPEPVGPYPVGTTQFRLTMPDRPELLTADPDDIRTVLVNVWYPAGDVEGIQPQTYWDQDGITGKAYSQNSGMGNFWYAHLRYVKTNSYSDAPLTAEPGNLPVVIYSPGFYGLNTDNTMLMESMAARAMLYSA